MHTQKDIGKKRIKENRIKSIKKIEISIKYLNRGRKLQNRNAKKVWNSEIPIRKVIQIIKEKQHFVRNTYLIHMQQRCTSFTVNSQKVHPYGSECSNLLLCGRECSKCPPIWQWMLKCPPIWKGMLKRSAHMAVNSQMPSYMEGNAQKIHPYGSECSDVIIYGR